jgi:hypothetical protein
MRLSATGMLLAALMLGTGGVGLTGCGQGAAPESAASPVHGVQPESQDQQIRAAIDQHLKTVSSLNVQAFDTEISNVNVQGDHAQALVNFKVKDGQGVMQFAYQLDRRDGNWTVTQSNPIGAHSNGAPAQ